MLILFIAFLMMGGAMYLVLEHVSGSSHQTNAQLRRASGYATTSARDREMQKSARERIIEPMLDKFSDVAMRLSPSGNKQMVARRLQSAGIRLQPQTFLAVKGGLVLGGIVVGLLGALVLQKLPMVFVGIVFSAIGFIGPDFFLSRRIGARRDEMGRALPDTLDLLCVSVEAGLGFDSAIAKVCEKMHGPLVDEFDLMAREIRIGETRRQALRNLAARTESQEVGSFARSIIQAEELGTSLGRTLRVQAQDMRVRRQLAAEEKAMKAPIKLLFPTVLFIFPALFIVIIGPAAIGIVQSFQSL